MSVDDKRELNDKQKIGNKGGFANMDMPLSLVFDIENVVHEELP